MQTVQTVQSTFVLKVLSVYKTLKGGLEEERGKKKGSLDSFLHGVCFLRIEHLCRTGHAPPPLWVMTSLESKEGGEAEMMETISQHAAQRLTTDV